ncbi:MAG: ethanolamine ammonia-lyase subunit EutC [Candidatus Competibacteraceae bacterium]|nr:ethanolamine ammonia-lyase subunit EutC [Candidatus Competibacteraceae bacterium]
MTKRKNPVVFDAWQQLRTFTAARIALGHCGASLPTQPHLEFQLAHAQARDAVHLLFDVMAVQDQLQTLNCPVIPLHSAASDRREYLQRPDLGRRLDEPSRGRLVTWTAEEAAPYDVGFVVADGLSALAIHRHAVPFLKALLPLLSGWRIAPIVLIEHGRVAISDEVGALLGVRQVVILIGERPGLSSPDSLGLYLTYQPRIGLTDADRNCISNIRPQGLSYRAAANKLVYLLNEARRRQLSGVNLKDEEESVHHEVAFPRKNFLLD